MPVNPQEGGISFVVPGWSGSLTATIGARSATVTPTGRTSAMAIVLDFLRRCRAVHGGQWDAWTLAGQLVIVGPAAFTLSASGTVATQLGLTGTYEGQTSYTGGDCDGIAWEPARPHIYWASAGISAPATLPTATGAAAVPPVREAGSVTVRAVYDSAIGEMLEVGGLVAGETLDVWVGGSYRGRVRVGAARAVTWGGLPGLAYLEADGLEVAR